MGAKEDNSLIKLLMKAGTVGIQLVTSTFVGLAIGYFLDKLFGTKPWLTIIFLVFGIATGFIDLFRFAKGAGKGDDKKPV